ncbi:MAG: three-Cys-motif partner protein TcmP [Bacteroidia bacterium]|jgi:three-Cys-motif partner protein|nr:three-Cys-motif partner protein TcmP [Bacteroidia bacterium]
MTAITTGDFFKQTRTQSEVKSEILNEYFKAWAAILLIGQKFMKVNNLLYIDLYSGKGYYDDDTPSSPIKILKSIHDNQIFNNSIKTFFNDIEPAVIEALKQNIKNLPYYYELKHEPRVLNEVSNIDLLKRLLEAEQKTPSLTFIDPFGYKGLSAELCLLAVKNWGSDLFMLFNINRIRPGIKNSTVEHLMKDLFAAKFEEILARYDSLNIKDREDFILDKFIEHFKDRNYKALKFKVEFEDKDASSHYLLFVSKVDIAYLRMKEIMSKYSDKQADGVPWFSVNNSRVQDLFTEYSIVNLKSDLINRKIQFNNKTIEEIYSNHNFYTPYIKENYKKAFSELILEEPDKICAIDKNGKPKMSLAYTSIIRYK